MYLTSYMRQIQHFAVWMVGFHIVLATCSKLASLRHFFSNILMWRILGSSRNIPSLLIAFFDLTHLRAFWWFTGSHQLEEKSMLALGQRVYTSLFFEVWPRCTPKKPAGTRNLLFFGKQIQKDPKRIYLTYFCFSSLLEIFEDPRTS